MSTLQTTNLKHPDAAGNQITFTSGGDTQTTGKILLGTTDAGEAGADDLTVAAPLDAGITIRSGSSSSANLFFSDGTSGTDQYDGFINYRHHERALRFGAGAIEGFRLDDGGRLLVGASSQLDDGVALELKTRYNASGNRQKLSLLHTQFAADTSSVIEFNRSRDNFGGDTAVIDDSQLGAIVFRGYDGTQYSAGAGIKSFVDATPGNGDMPARLEFFTSNDGEATLRSRLKINGAGRLSGQARYVERVFNLLYARLVAHGGCSSGGPSGTFTDFDGSEPAFITVPRTTTTATSGYSFIGDGQGGAFTLFVGCGDNPVFGTHLKDSDAPEYRSWVLVDNQFVSALGGAPTNATRASLPTTP